MVFDTVEIQSTITLFPLFSIHFLKNTASLFIGTSLWFVKYWNPYVSIARQSIL